VEAGTGKVLSGRTMAGLSVPLATSCPLMVIETAGTPFTEALATGVNEMLLLSLGSTAERY